MESDDASRATATELTLRMRRAVCRWLRVGRSVYYGITVPVISFKVSAQDARAIRARARARKLSVSEYLRRQALPAKPARRRLAVARHPVSGLRFDPSSGPEVSEDEIRAVLADFP